MKKFVLLLAVAFLFSANASAFSLGDVADTGKVKMHTCLMDEAKSSLSKGTITSENVEKKAAEIAAVCAGSATAEVDPAAVKQAVEIIKALM